jgi:hypothetical protein
MVISFQRHRGAGHFLMVLNWSAPVSEASHELFGRGVIPSMQNASARAV